MDMSYPAMIGVVLGVYWFLNQYMPRDDYGGEGEYPSESPRQERLRLTTSQRSRLDRQVEKLFSDTASTYGWHVRR